MTSIRLPAITQVDPSQVAELLISTALPYIQVSGNLTSGENAVAIGDPIAWDSTAKKFINYNQGGSGDETTCVGFVRIGCEAADIAAGDCPIEVVVAGGVSYALVSAASAWNAAVITDLNARYVEPLDGLLFF